MYDNLDGLILKRIKEGTGTFFWIMTGSVRDECENVAKETGRESYRVLDGRLQALRKAKKIKFNTKTGWHLATK